MKRRQLVDEKEQPRVCTERRGDDYRDTKVAIDQFIFMFERVVFTMYTGLPTLYRGFSKVSAL